MRFKPRSYQALGIEHLLECPKAGLWAQPGMGKTSIVGSTVGSLYTLGALHRVLVLVPKRVLDTEGWSREFAKWDHLSSLEVANITGTPDERRALIAHGHTVQVINYELIPWLLKEYYRTWPWDTLVVDESTKLKDYAGVWFRGKPKRKQELPDGSIVQLPAEPGIKDAAKKCTRVWALSGTPAPNGVADLWPQIYLLDQGRRLGVNITQFRSRWMHLGRDGFSWKSLPGADVDVGNRVRDICLTLQARDYLDLPEVVQNVVDVRMPAKNLEEYRRLQKAFFLEIAKDGRIIEAANAAVLSGKLLQFANGFLYTEGNTEWEDIHDAKLAALQDLVEEAARPVIVCYKYRADVTRICNRFPQAVVFDGQSRTIEAFQRGDIPILLLQPASAGHGIDGLQDGTDTIIWYGLTWSLEEHDQALERIGPTRQLQSGHPRPVFCHYIATQGTVDKLVLQRLINKKTVQEILLEAMRTL